MGHKCNTPGHGSHSKAWPQMLAELLTREKIRTLWRLSSQIHVIQWADLVCIHVTPSAAFDTSHIADFDAERLVINSIITFCISVNHSHITYLSPTEIQ